MEIASSLRGDKHEFCFVVIKLNAVLEPVVLERGDCMRPDGTQCSTSLGESASLGILLVSTLFPPQHWL